MVVEPSVAPKDWHARLDGSFTRGLVGGEILMEWMHEQLNGGGRFSGGVDLQTNYGVGEAERRLKTAWLRTRLRHPLLGITFSLCGRRGTMSYAVFPDEETVLNWCRNTITFLRETDFGTLEEILSSLDNHNTHPADGHAKLYALARPNGRISLILNMSHAVLDIYSLGVIWQTLFDELALENNEPIDWGEEVENLPRPIANVLGEAYPQSWFGWFMTIFNAIRALSNAKAKSIHPPRHPQLAERSLATRSITRVFTEEETTHFIKRCKEAKISVTYAYIAIAALAMQELYGDVGSEQTQVFAMPYDGRRWLPASLPPAPPHSPPLANTTAYIRVHHSGPPLHLTSCASKEESAALRDARVKRILEFAERYKERSSKVVNSPTPGGILATKMLAPLLVKTLEKSDPEKPSNSIYSVVSHGTLEKVFPSKANVDGSDVVALDYRIGGRVFADIPMMRLYTWRGKLRVQHSWNSKYFDQKTFERIDAKALEYFNDFVASGDPQAIADGTQSHHRRP